MRKCMKTLVAGYICMTAIGIMPVFASMDMEITSSVAGISVSLNNYFAGSLEPEIELAEALAPRSLTESVYLASAAPAVEAEAQPEPQTLVQENAQPFTIFSVNQAEKASNETPTATAKKSDYENIAVSKVSGYVNVRMEPNTSSSVVGKIYNHCAATILDTVAGEGGSWYKIQSGTVTGYIKAQYFITGDEAETLAQQIGKEFATINTASLRLREKPDLTSETLTLLSEGAEYVVLGEEGDFYKIAIDNDMVGYVAQSYIKTTVRFDQAVSLEEEAAKKQEEQQRKQEAEAAMAALEEVKRVEAKKDEGTSAAASEGTTAAGEATIGTIAPNPEQGASTTVAAPTTSAAKSTTAAAETSGTTPIGPGAGSGSGSGAGSTAVTSATRTAIVAYAKQFLGNPYVFGGTSLTNGADCSGFTQGVFANFDLSIGRSARDQAAKGRTISVDEIQPGDLLFYASGDYINHVALYIGGGEVIHASNSTTGIIISPYNYRTPCKAVTFLD